MEWNGTCRSWSISSQGWRNVGTSWSCPNANYYGRSFTRLDISKDRVHITEDKLKHMDKLSPPKMVSNVKSLLGFTSFLHMHIPYYCEITGPIQDLVVGKKQKNADVTKEWMTWHDKALEQVKVALWEARVLAFPDTQKEFSLYTDASKFHMSRVLIFCTN